MDAIRLEEFNQRLVPNAYTALSLSITGSNDDPCLDLKDIENYNGMLLVSAAVHGVQRVRELGWLQAQFSPAPACAE